MFIQIKHPKESIHGNDPKNIFIAYDNQDQYLGHAYLVIRDDQTQIPYPRLIYIGMDVPQSSNHKDQDRVKTELFSRALDRSKQIYNESPEVKTRVYTGLPYNESEFNFYKNFGFEEDYTVLMQRSNQTTEVSKKKRINAHIKDISDPDTLNAYEVLYNTLFISPLDRKHYESLMQKPLFAQIEFHVHEHMIGGLTLYSEGGKGWIETMFVLPEYRNQGFSKEIMQCAISYFHHRKTDEIMLEVWKLNTQAYELYRGFGFEEIGKILMFPGITYSK